MKEREREKEREKRRERERRETGSQKTFSEDVMETLVVVLANLFGRRHFSPCVKNFKKKFSRSTVILDDLPKDFAAVVVEEHNDRIQKNFGSFLLSISRLADMRKEYQLPLSEIDFSGKKYEDSQLVSHLMPGAESRTAVSPFACLSNITDQDLFGINVVNDAMLRTIEVNVKNTPFLCLNKCDKNGRKCPLNGYVLNFYKHGSLRALTLDNRYDLFYFNIFYRYMCFCAKYGRCFQFDQRFCSCYSVHQDFTKVILKIEEKI
ncbi:hypothetical protein HPG69_006648 [Diceros bicornis minor]|uniref:Uncharacterized protein n=1 Tax=Diceros bicornis minor TaxID=77932 RepID=A0A7J7F6A1_DICBM|nr:hypothetical protein HPG69_006648 [Diceros bicornis minor]